MKVISIDGLEINDKAAYEAWLEAPYSQPSLQLEMTERAGEAPLVSQARRSPMTFNLRVRVYAATAAERTARRRALLAALDTERAAAALVVGDDDTGDNPRFRYVVARAVEEADESRGTGLSFVATLVAHGDPYWRAVTPTTVVWAVTASGQTQAVVNGGDMEARPTVTLTPTGAKAGDLRGWKEQMFVIAPWTSYLARRNYPYSLTNQNWDTGTLVGSGDITSVNNIGVVVDGRLTRRWVSGYGFDTTNVWVNLDFAPAAAVALATTIGSGDVVTTVQASWNLSGFPARGMFYIGQEVFTYEGKDDVARRFLGVRRAMKSTTAGTHDAGEMIYWLQHEIWIVYGGSGDGENDVEAAEYGRTGAPLMYLSSWNNYWYFSTFGETPESTNRTPPLTAYAGASGEASHIADEDGLWTHLTLTSSGDVVSSPADRESWWSMPLAYGVTELYVTGEAIRYDEDTWDAGVDLGAAGGRQLAIARPTAVSSWQSFTYSHNVEMGAFFLEEARFFQKNWAKGAIRLDTLIISFGNAPAPVMMPPQSFYDMNLELRNLTTGQALTARLGMALNDQLTIDTEAHTATTLDDGENVYYGLTKDARRRDLLPLQPGSNTLQVTEAGLTGVTIHLEFEARTYG